MGARTSSERAAPARPTEKQSLGQFFKELPVLIVVALAIAILVKTYVVQAFFIPSGSMEDTLLINDRVIVSKFLYRFTEPRYPNIVVFVSPLSHQIPEPDQGPIAEFMEKLMEGLGLQTSEQDFIKRVIAIEGQTVEVKDGGVHVDGIRLSEPYVKNGSFMPAYGPTKVEKDQIFVMGDNRSSSEDSRVFGTIPRSSIVGKAVVLIWPLDRVWWIGHGES
jgi:signal peptidase I